MVAEKCKNKMADSNSPREDLKTSCVFLINFIKNIRSCNDLESFLKNLDIFFNVKGKEESLIVGNFPTNNVESALKEISCHRKLSKELLISLSQDFVYKNSAFPLQLGFKIISCFDITVTFLAIIEDAFHTKTRRNTADYQHSNFEIMAANCITYLLENGKLIDLIWKQCLELPVQVINGKSVYSPSVNMQWDNLIKIVVGLPDIVANKLKLKTNSIILPAHYFTVVAISIKQALEKLHENLQKSRDCSLYFISELTAKICLRGHADKLYEKLLPMFSKWVKETPLWRRICSKMILTVHDNALESVIIPLLKWTECFELLPLLLDDEILKRPKLKFLMTHKLLLVKNFSDEIIPYNILHYMATSKTREALFKGTLLKLLKVWGDHGSMKNIPFDQHLYLSKCILMSLSLLTPVQKKEWKQEITLKLLDTVQPHLESPSEKLRIVGMVLAECVTAAIDHNGKQLNFELERTDDLNFLYELATDPRSAISSKKEKQQYAKTTIPARQVSVDEKPKSEKENLQGILSETISVDKEDEEELDSDDDLEPINVKNGVEEPAENDDSVNGVQPPAYLRDCIAGLLSSKDPNRLEACLNVLEKLVKKEPGDLRDVSIELLRILLHLEDEYNINGFYGLRMNAMVTITTKCPSLASEYLCDQFFEENYSISQRLDLLEVISASVTILSKPDSDQVEELRKHLPLPTLPSMHQNEARKPEWQMIVDERVKKKTRRFVSGKKVAIVPNENRLTEVVGSFFFPLLKKFGMNLNGSTILVNDAMILGKYIYTLAVVMKSADGLMVVTKMGKSLLGFIWSLKYHKEAFVRQALVFALSKIVLHVPAFVLMNELQREIIEAKEWLQELIGGDPDAECQKLAVSCYMLLEKTIQQELVGGT